MKTHIFSALALSCFLLAPAIPVQAAQVATNGTEAQQRAGDEGYIIFAYADGWDAFGEARCKELLKSKAILKAAGNAVLLPVAIPEMPDEAKRAEHEAYLGGLKIPGSRSYPCLIFLYKDGGHYATLLGSDVTKSGELELAALIADRVAKGQERYRLFRRAETEKGPTRARTLFEGSNIEELAWPGKWLNQAIQESDPGNETGILDSINFNAYGFAESIGKDGVQAGLERVDKMLANPIYTPRQKQQMCAAAIGMLRRQGGLGEAETMRRYVRLMQELVPDSPEGRAASRIMRTWIPGLRYGGGWNPSCIPATKTDMEMEGDCPIKASGTYTVTFVYTGGGMGLGVDAVTLYDGKRKVAEDVHRGFAGNNPESHIYTLVVPKSLKKPRLVITLGQSNRDSYGRIEIKKQ